MVLYEDGYVFHFTILVAMMVLYLMYLPDIKLITLCYLSLHLLLIVI